MQQLNELITWVKSKENADFQMDEEAVKADFIEYKSAYGNISLKVLSILGGLLATASFMGFLVLTGFYDSDWLVTISGFVFIAASVLLNNKFDHLLLDTTTIATHVIGYVLISLGFDGLHLHERYFIVTFMLISVTIMAFSENYMIALISVLVFSGSLAGFFEIYDLENYVIILFLLFGGLWTWVSARESVIISGSRKLKKLFQPVHLGLFIAFAAVVFFLVMDGKLSFQIKYLWVYALAAWAGIIYLIMPLFGKNGLTDIQSKICIVILAVLLLIPSLYAPYIAGVTFILLLTYKYGFRTQFALSVAFLVYAFSQYYYDLNMTLLAKSGILFGSGALLLLGRLIFNKQLTDHE
jgi:hypothetical protein